MNNAFLKKIFLFIWGILFPLQILLGEYISPENRFRPIDESEHPLGGYMISEKASVAQPIETEKPFVVVVPSYMNLKWVERNLDSILTQDYSNYRVIYIDDCSPDRTGNAVKNYVQRLNQERRVTLIRNAERRGSLFNLYHAITQHCLDNEIVICVDGDDWLAHNKVLQTLNAVYSSNDIWLTHGTLMEYHLDDRNGAIEWSIPIPNEVVIDNTFRNYRCATHSKTFYAWLFKKIKLADLQRYGEFFPVTGDQAIIFPMIEMSGERHAFITEINYIYNMTNSLGDSIVATKLQREFEAYIRNLPRYERLN